MSKSIFIVFMLLLFVSCNTQDPCASNPTTKQSEESLTVVSECPSPTNPTPAEPNGPMPEPDPEVPVEAALFDANISLNSFDAKDEVKLLKAITIIKSVIRTEEFRQRVLNFSYKGQKTFVDNDGLTNEEIYQKLLDGAETLRPYVDNQMDLELELYYSSRSTVGYTYANVLRIWMNTKYFASYTPTEVAGNVFHEWTHKLGFDHASSYSVSRDSSVPYALGYLMEELGKKFE